MQEDRWNYKDKNSRRNVQEKDPGEEIQNMIEEAIEQFDFFRWSGKIRSNIEETTTRGKKFRYPKERKPREVLPVFRRVPGRYSGPLALVLGLFGTVVCLAAVIGLGAAVLGGAASLIAGMALGLPVVLGLGCLSLSVYGWIAYKRSARYLKYQKIWKDKSHIMIEDLSKETGYSSRQIKKDLHRIIEAQLLPFSRFDRLETCMIFNQETYSQYEAAEHSRELRQQQEEEKRKEEEAWAQAPVQERAVHEMEKDASRYLETLTLRKQEIQSEDIKGKISQLELMITRIYDCVKEHPEKYSQIHRLNDYYIPTTLKLLETYDNIEDQPIQGDNILKTKNEIESSLDMINQALVIMFDDLFQDVAMDTSADIQVLKTMLAREGWKEQELKADSGQDLFSR